MAKKVKPDAHNPYRDRPAVDLTKPGNVRRVCKDHEKNMAPVIAAHDALIHQSAEPGPRDIPR